MLLESLSSPVITPRGIATNSYERKSLVNRPRFSTQEGFISTKYILKGAENQKEEP